MENEQNKYKFEKVRSVLRGIENYYDLLINSIDFEVALGEILRNNKKLVLEPKTIRLDACTLCNLNCKTCYMRRHHFGNVGAGYLTAESFERFLENNGFVLSVELSNNGEAFLNPELAKIFRIANNCNVTASLGNGVNLNYATEEALESLVKYNVHHVLVSIDGVSQGVYQNYRVGGNVDSVIKNIKIINKYKEKYATSFPVLIWQYVLMPENEDEAQAAKDLAKELGMNIVYKLDWEGEFIPKNRKRLSEITGLEVFNRIEFQKKYGRAYVTGACSQILLEPQINWDGRLLGCCGNFRDSFNHNVFEEGLHQSLNSDDYREFICDFLEGRMSKRRLEICKKCSATNDTIKTDVRKMEIL